MKTDYHCHILPGIDDGAQTLEESIELARAIAKWGFDRAICTPHIVTKFRNNPESISNAYDMLQKELDKNRIDLNIEWSAEYRLVPETWHEVLENKWLKPFDGNHILIELPIHNESDMGNIDPVNEIRNLRDMGFAPILAHPERYAYLNDEQLYEMLDAGVLFQIDYTSLAGVYDKASEDKALELVSKGLDSDFYGTDLHNRHYVTMLDRYFARNAIK